MIPARLHQVDLGQWSQAQRLLAAHARQVCSEWQCEVWTLSRAHEGISRWGVHEMVRRGRVDQATSIAACDAVGGSGGIYIDANMLLICRPERLRRAARAFISWEGPRRVTSRIFGAEANHPFFRACQAQVRPQLTQKLGLEREWECGGRFLLEEVFAAGRFRASVPILPSAIHFSDIGTVLELYEAGGGRLPEHIWGVHLGREATLERIGEVAEALQVSLPSTSTNGRNGRVGAGARQKGQSGEMFRPSERASLEAKAEPGSNRRSPKQTCEAIVLDSNGIGDLIVGAYAVAGVKRHRPESHVTFAVRRQLIGWAQLFVDADAVTDVAQGRASEVVHEPYRSYGALEIPQHGRQTRHAYYAEECGVAPEAPRCQIPEADTAWAMQAGGVGARTVIVSPFSAFAIRSWPLHYFADLIMQLNANGVATIVVDGPGDGKRSASLRTWHYWGLSPTKVAALFQRASVVVGSDSGMVHLAGALGCKAVAICGSTSAESVFGHYGCVAGIQSPTPCSPCYFHQAQGYRHACDLGCEALGAIPVASVLAATLAHM